jgi:hypothetical protein
LAEELQLGLDPRRAPAGVLGRHLPDERDRVGLERRPTALARTPSPEEPEGGAVPANDCLGLDDYEELAPAGPNANEESPDDAVSSPKPWSRRGPVQDGELLAEREVLEDEGGAGAEKGADGGEDGADEGDPRFNVSRVSVHLREVRDAVRLSS